MCINIDKIFNHTQKVSIQSIHSSAGIRLQSEPKYAIYSVHLHHHHHHRYSESFLTLFE